MSSASRRRRRRATLAGLCPTCLERPITYEVRLLGWRSALVACVECWPGLEAQLHSDGVRLHLARRR